MGKIEKNIIQIWYLTAIVFLVFATLMALSGCGGLVENNSAHAQELKDLLRQNAQEKIVTDKTELEQFLPGDWALQTFELNENPVNGIYSISFGDSASNHREINIYSAPPFLNYQPAITVMPQLDDYPACQEIFSDIPSGISYLSDGREPLIDGYAFPQRLSWGIKTEGGKLFFQSFESGEEYPTCCKTANNPCDNHDYWRPRISSRARNYELLGFSTNAFLITDGNYYFVFLRE